MNPRSYSGADESSLLRKAQAEHPNGFEILSIHRTGWLWWRRVDLLVQPLTPTSQQEMSKIRLLSAIYSLREQRQHQAAHHTVMTHAYDFKPQRPR